VTELDFMLPDGTRVQGEIIFIALDREEDIRKLRGLQLTGVYFNELRFIPLAIVREGLSRCDRYPQPGWSPWVGGIADTNAWDEDHPLEEMMSYFSGMNAEIEDENLRYAFEQMSKLGAWEFFNQPGAVMRAAEGEKGAYRSLDGSWWKINPNAENLHVLSPTYYARQIAGAKTDWIRVNLGNETGLAIDGKPVHPEYSDAMHRSDKLLLPIPGRVIRVGLDFGLTPAAVFWQQHPTGRWHGIDELVCFDMGAERFADALKRKVAAIRAMIPRGDSLEFVFRGDPSGDSRASTDERKYFDVLRNNGIPALPATTNDTAIRRDAFTRPLTRLVDGGPGLLLSPLCKMLRKALKGAWCYRRVKVAGSDRFKDEAEKNDFSHVGEAAEYGLMDAGEHAVVNSSQAKHFPKGPVTPRIAPSGRDWLDVGW
jgi:hypothetical protein